MKCETITTTWLELARPEMPEQTEDLPQNWRVVRAESIPLHFYRYLYAAVGSGWDWGERTRFKEDELHAILRDPDYHCYIPYYRGCPSGLIELDARALPEINLKYFGLIPEWVGKGAGPSLLRWAQFRAWELGAERLWLHTCTDDHPGALKVYQRAGLAPYKSETGTRT